MDNILKIIIILRFSHFALFQDTHYNANLVHGRVNLGK